MKKFIILLVLFLGSGIVLSAQQFDNAGFAQSANCDIDDCTIPDEMTCLDGWWQYIQTGQAPYLIEGGDPWYNYVCNATSCDDGDKRGLNLRDDSGAGTLLGLVPTTNNPLTIYPANLPIVYALNMKEMLVTSEGGGFFIRIMGTNTNFTNDPNFSIADFSTLLYESPKFSNDENICESMGNLMAQEAYNFDYAVFNSSTKPSFPILGHAVPHQSVIDNLELCPALKFLAKEVSEECIAKNEICLKIIYNETCFSLGCDLNAEIDVANRLFYIEVKNPNGSVIENDIIFLTDAITEYCVAPSLNADGSFMEGEYTYTIDFDFRNCQEDPDNHQASETNFIYHFEVPVNFETHLCSKITAITSNQTWTAANTGTNGYLRTGDILVKAGTTLTIEDGVTLAFCENTGLLIEQNARVNLKGTLTACDKKWNGVQVYGSANTFTQGYQTGGYQVGRFFTYETAIIENAIHAVDLFGPMEEYVGGVLIAEGSTFKNFYQSGIRINPFENHSTLSGNITGYAASFNNCDFIIENDFSPMPFWKMVELKGVRGVYFRGCNFENQQDLTKLSLNYYGLGIYARNSSFRVDYYCPTIIPFGEECPQPTRSTFTGLTTGVMTINTMTEDKGYSIKNSEFRHCETGIYSFASSYGIITQNDFYLGNAHLFEGFNPAMFGVRFYGEQTGFFFEENNFQLDEPANINSNYTIGSLCYDIGETNNYIRLNNYTGLLYGNLSNGKNFEDEDIGLVYLCNTNDNANTYTYTDDNNTTVTVDGADFVVTDEGIRKNQAFIKVNEFDITEYNPAGNHFSYTNIALADFNNEGGNITYYYSTHASSATDEIPVLYSMATIELEDRNQEDECEAREAPGIIIDINDHIVKFTTHKTDWQTAKSSYLALLDGGDTEVLLQQIATASPGDATLHNNLMTYSPYLSKQLMETLVNTATFTGDDLFNILDANPGVRYSEGFYSNLLTAGTGLDFTQVLALQNNQNVSNARTELELSIAYHRQEMDYHAKVVITTTLDSEEIEDVDFINNWYTAVANKNADYKSVESLIQKGLYADAQNMLAAIPTAYKLSSDALTQHNAYATLSNLVINIHQGGYQPKDIPTAILDDIYQIYETATGIAKYKAAALYSTVTDKLFLEYNLPAASNLIIFLSGEGDDENISLQNEEKKKQAIVANISVYPNPAKDIVYFKNLQNISQLKITDITGSVILQTDINDSSYQWETRTINNGIYFYTLYTDKMPMDVGKIVVDK